MDEDPAATTADSDQQNLMAKPSKSAMKRDERVRRRDWLSNRDKRYNEDYQKPTKKIAKGAAATTTKQVRKHDLIFIDDSPDYCRPDTESGVAGRE
jgi:hypothetical protein